MMGARSALAADPSLLGPGWHAWLSRACRSKDLEGKRTEGSASKSSQRLSDGLAKVFPKKRSFLVSTLGVLPFVAHVHVLD